MSRVPASPRQRAWRSRIETGIRVAEPFLNLVLAAGDLISRTVDREPADSHLPARRVEPVSPQGRVGTGGRAA